jgi:acetyltransferase-like isoleucine patch superfamily enzyme
MFDRLMDRLARVFGPRWERQQHDWAVSGLRLGKDVTVGREPEIYSPQCIELGDGVQVGHRVRLQAITNHNGQTFKPQIRLGRGVSLENDCTITCVNQVELGDGVMVASNVFMSDHEHRYDDPDRSVQVQDLTTDGRVMIGAGSHIGQNVCIFGRVTIGEHCVIGANAVVTGDIPAYSVAVGAPARVVRQYDRQSRQWRRV